jgi:cell division protein FtsW
MNFAGNLRANVRTFLVAPLDAAPAQTTTSGPVDQWLGAVVIALMGFGVVMVYSASEIFATVTRHDPQYFLLKQAGYTVAALGIMAIVSKIDYHRLYKLTYPVLFSVIAMLIATIVGFGHRGGGAARWLHMGIINVQPAEVAKLALIIWLAYSLAKKADRVKSFTVGFLPHLLVAGFLMLLCLKQPDFGSAVVLLLLTFTLLFMAGAKIGYIMGAVLTGGALAVLAVRYSPYRFARWVAWAEMEKHRQDLAYQPFQSVMSFGAGGLHGVGLGRGLQTLYLPEAHTDFVSAIVGEELGFIGIAALSLAYVVLCARGIRAALSAPDDFGSYLAFGISTLFALQTLVNLSVALAILPTKGLTLPFVSYGGSSLLVNAAAVGILLNITRQIAGPQAVDAQTEGSDGGLSSVAEGPGAGG